MTRIVAPTRCKLRPHPKLDNPLVDFQSLPAEAAWWGVDGGICTLGTTIRKASSQEAFRRVDQDYVLAVARRAQHHGARAFALNSATGANPGSRFFYSRVKGEVEAALRRTLFPSLTLVRPALIGGNRKEFRPVEFVAMRLLQLTGPLLPCRYRIVPHDRIAKILLEAAVTAPPGEHIIESEALHQQG